VNIEKSNPSTIIMTWRSSFLYDMRQPGSSLTSESTS